MTEPLLTVDVQRCFLNEFTRHIPERIARLIERDRSQPILFTRFVNQPDGPWYRFLDWRASQHEPDTNLAPELLPFANDEPVFTKPGLAGISDELASYLKENRIERVTIAGIDTDMCVLKVALDIFDLGIQPVILVDCCASTADLRAHLACLAVLAREIGAANLRDAGLSCGRLAAPPFCAAP